MNAPRKCSFSFRHHFFLGMGAFIIFPLSAPLSPTGWEWSSATTSSHVGLEALRKEEGICPEGIRAASAGEGRPGEKDESTGGG
jgi:hypothetical protein